MKMTKLLGLTLLFALLVVPASVKGKSMEECLGEYYASVISIKDVNDLCGLTKTLLNCIGSGRSLSSEQREKLKSDLHSEFNKHNLNCDYSIDEAVDEAFNGAKTSSTSLSFLTLILVAFGGFTLARTLA